MSVQKQVRVQVECDACKGKGTINHPYNDAIRQAKTLGLYKEESAPKWRAGPVKCGRCGGEGWVEETMPADQLVHEAIDLYKDQVSRCREEMREATNRLTRTQSQCRRHRDHIRELEKAVEELLARRPWWTRLRLWVRKKLDW